jgi:hypothetical protein
MKSKEIQMRIDFENFSDYLDNYSSILDGTKPLSNFINSYYKNTEVQNFNSEKLSKFAKELLDYQGNPIVNDDNIKCLGLARDFALSNDPQKRQTYLCTVEQKMLFDNEDEITVIAKVKVTGISDNYLKLVGLYEEENYKYYLADKSSAIVNNRLYKTQVDSQEDQLIQYKVIT